MSHNCPGHGHGGCNGDSDLSLHDDSPEMGIEYSLYTKVDKENLTCLNEQTEGSGKSVFKPFDQRLNFETVSSVSICCLI